MAYFTPKIGQSYRQVLSLYFSGIRLAKRRKSNYFITTPIFYVNASPHIGHLYTLLLADASSRFQKLKEPDLNLKFMTGTDEHGLKISLSAQERKMGEKEFCDMVSQEYKNLASVFGVGYTDFLRTTEDHHKKNVERIWNLIFQNGYIYSSEYSGWYCVSDETFVPQTNLSENIDSQGYKYTLDSKKPVQYTKEINYKFKLSAFKDDLLYWLKKDCKIVPHHMVTILQNSIENGEGFSDLSVSRPVARVKWGIPVPNDPSQIIYVWLDALTSYLTSCGYPDSMVHWPPDLQIIGKDILRFHGIYWPAFLMAVGLEPPKSIFCHSHWMVAGEKMSKSLGNVIDPMGKISSFSAEGFRYFLLHQGSPLSDLNYDDTKLKNVINADLANCLGNLLCRCVGKVINPQQVFPSYCGANHSKYCSDATPLMEKLSKLPDLVYYDYDNLDFHLGIRKITDTMALTNKFFQDMEPWTSVKNNDKERVRAVLHITMEALRVCGILLQPIVPITASNLLDKLSVGLGERSFNSIRPFSWEKNNQTYDVSLATTSVNLFPRI